jgi:Tfp pilus assembly protein FimT
LRRHSVHVHAHTLQKRQIVRLTNRGFSLLELMVVIAISITITGMAVPTYLTIQKGLQTRGDGGAIQGMVAEAKLRAASNFTHARVYADLTGKTLHLEVWNKTNSCWQTDGDTANCTGSTSPVVILSSKVSFGYGNVGTPPANTQTTIGQAPLCYTGYAGQSTNTTSIANTACIEFNSRGVPSDPAPGGSAGSAGGVPDTTGALYVTDGSSVYAVTVIASGATQTWYTRNNSTPNWQHR